MWPAEVRLALLYGAAVGDALGAATEFSSPSLIERRYGRVTGYVAGSPFGFAPGEFTDDTQMVLCTLAAYADGGDLVEQALARYRQWCFAEPPPPDVSYQMREALRYADDAGVACGFVAWARSGYHSAGNAGLIRTLAPLIAGRAGKDCCRDTVRLAALTHPDPRSLLACLVLAAALEQLLCGQEYIAAWQQALAAVRQFDLSGCIDACFGATAAAEVAARYDSALTGVSAAVTAALRGEVRSQSAYVLDTLQAAVARGMAGDYLSGVLAAVNMGNDADTVAAVAGGLLAAAGNHPPKHLIDALRGGYSWPVQPDPAGPARAVFPTFVP